MEDRASLKSEPAGLAAASPPRLRIAVIGSGIAGLSAAWLLARRHRVILYESANRLGGHSNTLDVDHADGRIAVDTGFIVYNEENYPNLTALFRHLGVATRPSNMSFAASVDDGRFEYSGSGLKGLLAQKRNLARPRFWRMIREIIRFYGEAAADLREGLDDRLSLARYLEERRYSRDFIEHHLMPMGAAIWSSPVTQMRDYPAASFIRFFANHGLLRLSDRPQWRTVSGGSRQYVKRLAESLRDGIRLSAPVVAIHSDGAGVRVLDASGAGDLFDHVVVATHADQALEMLAQPTQAEAHVLGRFRYQENSAVLHQDANLMPRRRQAWSSWNYLRRRNAGDESEVCITYWMNRLQDIRSDCPLFVTLNPHAGPRPELVRARMTYDHPIFDSAAKSAQTELWTLQGRRNIWFCGSYFGDGFHEDALQSGLTVAEQLGGLTRPWTVPEPNGRIIIGSAVPEPVS